jgi:hypothetical protein
MLIATSSKKGFANSKGCSYNTKRIYIYIYNSQYACVVFVAEAAMAAKRNDKAQGIPDSSYLSCCQQNHKEKNKGLVDNNSFSWFRSSSGTKYCKQQLALNTTSMAAQWFVYFNYNISYICNMTAS